jgi:transposase
MATKIRRSFTDEFKREAVSLLTSSGRPLTQVARELGIQPSMLRHWRDDQQTNGTVTRTARSPSSDSMSAEHAEIWRLEKELARAQMERDILKRMARPLRKRFLRCDLSSLHQRIRPMGSSPCQDGDPRVTVLTKATASSRHF